MLHSKVGYCPYPQTLDEAGKAAQGQALSKFNKFRNKLERLFVASLFQPSLMFAGKVGAYPSEEPFRFNLSREAPYPQRLD